MVEEALNEIKQDRRWLSTKGCTEATVDASRDYCRAYFQARQEHAGRLEYARLEQLRDATMAGSAAPEEGGSGAREADPQASMLVRLSRGMLELAEAQLWLNSWAALVVEMGAALIPVVAMGHGFSAAGGGREKSNGRDGRRARVRSRRKGAAEYPAAGAGAGWNLAGAGIGQWPVTARKDRAAMDHYVVSVGGQKGGTGKSTVAQGIAVEAARTGAW